MSMSKEIPVEKYTRNINKNILNTGIFNNMNSVIQLKDTKSNSPYKNLSDTSEDVFFQLSKYSFNKMSPLLERANNSYTKNKFYGLFHKKDKEAFERIINALNILNIFLEKPNSAKALTNDKHLKDLYTILEQHCISYLNSYCRITFTKEARQRKALAQSILKKCHKLISYYPNKDKPNLEFSESISDKPLIDNNLIDPNNFKETTSDEQKEILEKNSINSSSDESSLSLLNNNSTHSNDEIPNITGQISPNTSQNSTDDAPSVIESSVTSNLPNTNNDTHNLEFQNESSNKTGQTKVLLEKKEAPPSTTPTSKDSKKIKTSHHRNKNKTDSSEKSTGQGASTVTCPTSLTKDSKFKTSGTGIMNRYTDEKNNGWLFKPAINKYNNEVSYFRAYIQEAAYQVQKIVSPATSVPVFTTTVDGQFGALQQQIPNVKAFKRYELIKYFKTGEKTNKKLIVQVIKEHIIDWLLCNFDSHDANFLLNKENKLLYGIDKEQSMKYINEPLAQTINTDYHPNKTFNEAPPVYNALYKGIQSGKYDIDLNEIFNKDLKPIFNKINSLSDENYRKIFENYAFSLKDKDSEEAKELLDKIVQRKKDTEKNFKEFFAKIQPQSK